MPALIWTLYAFAQNNRSTLPEFSVQLIDANGIGTTPAEQERVEVSLLVDRIGNRRLFAPDARITEVADGTGKAHFKDVKIDADSSNWNRQFSV
eukprot:SAG31_NODE_24421_length_481_cov_1.350785_1_plen_93_part_10